MVQCSRENTMKMCCVNIIIDKTSMMNLGTSSTAKPRFWHKRICSVIWYDNKGFLQDQKWKQKIKLSAPVCPERFQIKQNLLQELFGFGYVDAGFSVILGYRALVKHCSAILGMRSKIDP